MKPALCLPTLDLSCKTLLPNEKGTLGIKRRSISRKRRIASRLAQSPPIQVMQEFLDLDPLGIRERIEPRLAHQAILLDPARLRWRAFAICAATIGRRGPVEPLESFLDRSLDAGIRSLVKQDWLAENDQDPNVPLEQPNHRPEWPDFVPAVRARRIALEFNSQDHKQRRLLYSIFVEGAALDEAAQTFGVRSDELTAMLNQLLDRVGGQSPASV